MKFLNKIFMLFVSIPALQLDILRETLLGRYDEFLVRYEYITVFHIIIIRIYIVNCNDPSELLASHCTNTIIM